MPIPLPNKVLQTSDRTHFFYENVPQTVLGMGMGMNVTAHFSPTPNLPTNIVDFRGFDSSIILI